jgi:hypothetical protein
MFFFYVPSTFNQSNIKLYNCTFTHAVTYWGACETLSNHDLTKYACHKLEKDCGKAICQDITP